MAHGSGELGGSIGIAFVVKTAPFRMADQHEMATEIPQHGGADFAGMGTGIMLVEGLGAQRDSAVQQMPANLGQIRERRAERDLDTVQPLEGQPLEQGLVGDEAAVHLPVSHHQRFPHAQLLVGQRRAGRWP
ncbi:hypothetical protein D9M70_508450 [compost metagenome]